MKKITHTLLTMALVFLGVGIVSAQNEFITTWETTSSNESITIPTNNSVVNNYDVDWGDGTVETGITGDATHQYTSSGIHTVKISGDIKYIYFNNAGDKDKILTIEQWGNIQWVTMTKAFWGCTNLNINATDAPDLSGVTNFNNMFQGASSLNADLSNWDVSTITEMNQTFAQATNFNGDITTWDVSNVISMVGMFSQATSFNQSIGTWDVSKVEDMSYMLSYNNFNQDIGSWNVSNVKSMNWMFAHNPSFNQEIGGWDVSSVSDMSGLFTFAGNFNGDISSWNVTNVTNFHSMFSRATSFNQNIGGWNVSNAQIMTAMFFAAISFNQDIGTWNVNQVTDMWNMFHDASAFNADISAWNTSKVTKMAGMFDNAQNFSQNLGGWNISLVTDMTGMFDNSGLSSDLYDNILQGWAAQSVSSNVTFGAAGIQYCAGSAAKNVLETTYNWTITDGGQYCVVNIPDANFKAALLANVSINTTDDGEITFQEAEAYSGGLDVSGLSISDLTGVEAFTALSTLTANTNDLTTLDLSNNTALTSVQAYNNFNLASVNVANLNNLASLNLTNAGITELNLSDLTALTTLYLVGTDLNTIDLSNNSLLQTVSLQNNNLTTIDLSSNTELMLLILNGNTLGSVDLSNNTKLQHLQVDNCGLTSGIDLSMLTQLTYLNARNNGFSAINLSSNVALSDLRLEFNNLTSLELSSNTALTQLRVSFNQLASLNLSGNSNLTTFYADNNLIQGIDISGNTVLHTFSVKNGVLNSLNVANGNNTNFVSFDVLNNPDLSCITVDDIGYSEINWTSIDGTTNFSTNCNNVQNDIIAFSLTEETSAATIDNVAHTVDIQVTFGTDLTNIIPTFTVSSGAIADPASGVAQDFSNVFTYTITAENPTAIQEWTVTVTEENVAPTDVTIDNSSIDENNAINDVIGTLSTTDGNVSDSHTYSLVTGTGDTDNSSFDISGSSLVALESFDFESKNSYSVRIKTDDGLGGTFEKEFTISVNDIAGVAQTIIFDALASKTFGDADFDLTATTTSILAVSYSSSDESIATISGSTVTIIGAGSTIITASQAGDGDYAAATNVEQVLTVNKLNQTIAFDALADKNVDDADFDLIATASSGLVISYTSSDGTVATISGSTVTIVGAGSTTITASQPGNGNYEAATDVQQELIVSKLDQTITFNAIDDQLIEDGTLTLTATATSGLDITYTIISGPAIVSGSTVTFTDMGTVTLEASQNGNETYSAAIPVEQTFDIITVTGIADSFTGKIYFYPNPVTDKIFVEGEVLDINQIDIVGLNGKQIISKRNNVKEIDVSHIKSGQYILRIITSDNVYTQQIIKQ